MAPAGASRRELFLWCMRGVGDSTDAHPDYARPFTAARVTAINVSPEQIRAAREHAPRRASPIWSNYGRLITAISKPLRPCRLGRHDGVRRHHILTNTSARSAISRPTTATLYSLHRTHVATKHRGARSSGDKSSRALMCKERNFLAERSATRYRALYPRLPPSPAAGLPPAPHCEVHRQPRVPVPAGFSYGLACFAVGLCPKLTDKPLRFLLNRRRFHWPRPSALRSAITALGVKRPDIPACRFANRSLLYPRNSA